MTVSVQISGLRPHQVELLRRTHAADCSRDEFDLFVETAQRCGLDPFRRQIVPLVLQKRNPARRRMVVLVTLEGQRVIAHRCGNYRPASEPPEYVLNRRRKSPANPHGIVRARTTLWQQDSGGSWFPVSGEAYWDEFAPVVTEWEDDPVTSARRPSTRTSLDPASSWARMPHLMIAKCATAQALRAGWPEHFGGLYTEEEMERAKLLDQSASDIVDTHVEERRSVSAAGPDAITVSWEDGWTLETIPVADFAARVSAWIEQPARAPGEVAEWAVSNARAIREFWGKRADEALKLKRLIEERSRSAGPELMATSSGTERAAPPPPGRAVRLSRGSSQDIGGSAELATLSQPGS